VNFVDVGVVKKANAEESYDKRALDAKRALRRLEAGHVSSFHPNNKTNFVAPITDPQVEAEFQRVAQVYQARLEGCIRESMERLDSGKDPDVRATLYNDIDTPKFTNVDQTSATTLTLQSRPEELLRLLHQLADHVPAAAR